MTSIQTLFLLENILYRKTNKKVNFSTFKGMNALLVANAEDLVSPSAFRATNPNILLFLFLKLILL